MSRDILLAQLWPDTETGKARHALTQSLYGLRRDLEAEIVLGTGMLRLNPSHISADVEDFRDALRRGDRKAAVEVYGGEFLDGFYVRDADEFERWVDDTRTELRQAYVGALEQLAREAADGEQLPWLQRLALAAPLDSRHAVRVAQIQAESGSPAMALKSLQSHEALVARELGAPVSKDVAALIQRLAAEAEAQQAERGRRSPPLTVAAIGDPQPPEATAKLAETTPTPRRSPRRALFAGSLALALALVFGWRAVAGRDSSVDPQKYVVLPFRHPDGASEELLSGANCAQLVSSMLESWKDVKRVDPLRVASALEQAGHPSSLEAILALARSLGAGRVIWGEVNPVGDSIRIRGAVFDTRHRNEDPLREAGFSVEGSLAGVPGLSPRELGTGFAKMTRELIVAGAAGASLPADGIGTNYSRALELKLRGDSAFGQWNLPLAREGYLAALAVDPAYPQANLNLAQLDQWDGKPRDAWRPYVVTALVQPTRLSGAQQEVAHALLAMADEEYPAACDRYRRMIEKDSANFVAWYGLGECQAEDHFLISDKLSPSGWRFRSSYHSAIGAYSKALKLVPLTSSAFGGAALSKLADRFYADPSRMRDGYERGDRSKVFLSFPGFARDTLVFWPYDAQKVLNGEIRFPGGDQAVQAAREALLSVAAAWVTALPRSIAALQANATALELARGMGGRNGDSALALLGNARALATPEKTFALGYQTVGVLLKQQKYANAAALADTLLGLGRFAAEDIAQAAILAALRGKVEQAADLMALGAERDTLYTPDGEAVDVPLPVRQMAQRLMVYAAFGFPRDSVLALRDEILNATAAMPAGERTKVRDAALSRATLLAFPLLGPPRDLGNVWAIERAIANGDTAAARREFARLDALRKGAEGSLPADATLLESRLRLIVGDTARAKAQLADLLAKMDARGLSLIPRMEHAASLGRLMLLYVDLSKRDTTGPAPSARVLWAGSPDRQYQLDSLRIAP